MDQFIVLLISESRTWLTLKRLAAQWPYWGFLLNQAFAGMNALFDQHGFPEHELEAMSMGLVALVAPSEE